MSPATIVRSEPKTLRTFFSATQLKSSFFTTVVTIALGSSLYGFTVGLWRGLEMAGYVALKTPLLIFSTLLITAFLNGVISLLLGTGIGFRKSLLCQLLSFSLASIVLASLSPITLFIALEAPGPLSPIARQSHSFYLLLHTTIVAFAGFLSVTKLYNFIQSLTPNVSAARFTLYSWLASNAFVGAQLSYLLRPFFGSPGLEVAFLREDPFKGTFYEAIWRSLNHLLGTGGSIVALICLGTVSLVLLHSILNPKSENKK